MMTSTAGKLPAYQRLTPPHDDGYYDFEKEKVVVTKPRSSSSTSTSSISSIVGWYKLKPRLAPSGGLRRRLRLRRRVVSVRRLMQLKRKIKLAYRRLTLSCRKVVKRLKDGQSHFGDLFAGNYMFMQVNPSSLKCLDRQRRSKLAGAELGNFVYIPSEQGANPGMATMGANSLCFASPKFSHRSLRFGANFGSELMLAAKRNGSWSAI